MHLGDKGQGTIGTIGTMYGFRAAVFFIERE
jgi:hypothetical protein